MLARRLPSILPELTMEESIETTIEKLGYSARAYDRILKVARTIADLDGASEETQLPHISEAAQFRNLDRL